MNWILFLAGDNHEQFFKSPTDYRECDRSHTPPPTTRAELRSDHLLPAPRVHPSSDPRCECNAGRYRTPPRGYAETSPQRTPATTVRAPRRSTRNKFCGIPTPSSKTRTAETASHHLLRCAELPRQVALHIADTNSRPAQSREQVVLRPIIPRTDRSRCAPTTLRVSRPPLHRCRPLTHNAAAMQPSVPA